MPLELENATIEALAAEARSGDREAFAELYRRTARSVHGILLARLGPAEAQELTQEVFASAWERRSGLRDPAQFGPWIHAMARNAAVALLRRRGRRPKEEPLPESAKSRATGPGELGPRVLEAIRGLPEAYHEPLLLRLVEGMTGPEIAEVTGLGPASVRVNLCRGMEMLREALRKDGWP
jgi:RNA polymerase sigma-70 factor (ECF subfamily)